MKLHSLSISGIVTMNLHSLNNEGSEGNTTMTRMVEIVDAAGKNHTVNAVSGDMFKHIQAEHLFCDAKANNLPLCSGCETFDANRICADESFTKKEEFNADTKDSEILSEAIRSCIIDDTEGILITSEIGKKKRSIAHKSAVEFGWVVGCPDNTKTESYFHAKYVPEGRGKGSGAGENLGQNIFHRPASSGQYAVVTNVDLYKVGRNDITLAYIEGIDRQARIKALLRSILNTFLKPTGAHRNTQHPHILDFSGVVTTSLTTLPSPVVSGLNPTYIEEITQIVENLNRTTEINNSIETGSGAFSQVMADIIESVQPYGE
ncbi:MAG: DevR family CRISPR-associated autoregulator [bacterium]